MRYFTDAELLQIIEDDESDRVEFKESLSGSAPTEIREAICAFANDLPNYEKPGFVFLGVRRDKTIVGLSVKDELLRQLADMKTDGNIIPLPSLTVEKRLLQGQVFHLTPADGAIGAHAAAARGAYKDFKILAEKIVEIIGIKKV